MAKLDDLTKTLASKESIDELKLLLTLQSEKINQQNEKISILESTVLLQKDQIDKLEDRLAVVSSVMETLTKQADGNEQYSRRYCLRLKGIEQAQNESASDCVNKVVKVCNDLNLNIQEEDIDRAHRIGKDKKAMIVKFYSFKKRTLLYRKRKDSTVKIHLDLTKNRIDLLDKANKLVSGLCFCGYKL